jgi:hypothetical protein
MMLTANVDVIVGLFLTDLSLSLSLDEAAD